MSYQVHGCHMISGFTSRGGVLLKSKSWLSQIRPEFARNPKPGILWEFDCGVSGGKNHQLAPDVVVLKMRAKLSSAVDCHIISDSRVALANWSCFKSKLGTPCSQCPQNMSKTIICCRLEFAHLDLDLDFCIEHQIKEKYSTALYY